MEPDLSHDATHCHKEPPLGPIRARRFFEKGVLRFIVLDLLSQKPSHGYEIIHNLEDIFHGFYSPSPGSIYPTLQLMEDQGYITPDRHTGKKIYAITTAGLSYLDEHAAIVKELRLLAESSCGTKPRWQHEDFRATAAELRLLGRTFIQYASGLNREQMDRVREIVRRATIEITDVIDLSQAKKSADLAQS